MLRKTIESLALLACVGTMGVLASSAQGPGGGGRQQPRPVLQALDTDHDGQISAAELKAAPVTLKSLDKNGDGQITNDELSQRPENAGAAPSDLTRQLMSFDKDGKGYLVSTDLPDRMQGLFTRADANHDGKLTPEELNALAARQGMPNGPAAAPGRAEGMFRMDPLLNALDTNHDGIIENSEIANSTAALLALDKNGDGMLTPDEMRPRQQTPEERANHMLGEFDTNQDGKISKEEAPERMQAQFGQIDKNGDGFLDRAELAEWFKTQNAGPGGPGGGPPREH